MTLKAGSAYVDVLPRLGASFAADIDKAVTEPVKRAGEKAGGILSSTFGQLAATVGGLFAVDKVKEFLSGAVEAGREANKTEALVANAIKATGGVANVTADHVSSLASKLSAVDGVNKEVIQSSEQVLLRFSAVRDEAGKGNDIFDRTVALSQDMATALGTDAAGAAKLLSKALSDPAKGMTALRRAAVVLTQAQQDQIKTFEKSGDTLDAQKVLLDALSSKFSGAAAAVATPSAKLRASLHTVTEEIGQFLIPGIDAASSFIAAHLPGALALFETGVSKVRSVLRPVVADVQLFASAIRAGFDSFGDTSGATGLAKTFEHIGGTIRTVYDEVVSVVNAISEGFSNGGALQGARGISATLEQLGGVIRSIAQYVEAHWKPILIGVGAALLVLLSPVVAVTAALVLLYARSQTFRDVIATIAEFITADVVPALGQLADFFTNKVVPAVELVVGYMSDQFSHLVDYVRANWTDIQKAISNVLKAIEVIVAVTLAPIIVAWDLFHKQILATLLLAWKQVQNIVDTAIRIVRDIITVVLALLSGDWGKAWNALKDIPAAILTYVGKTLQIAFGVLEQLFSAALALLGTAWSLGWDALKSAVSALISWVVGEIKALPGQLLGLITGIASAAASIGGAIFHGIGDIIAGLPNLVTGIAKDAINGVIGLINDFIRFLDGLSIGIPKVHVPGTSIDVGGGSVGFPHIPTIPTLGAGGTAIAPGVAVVGDKGPELIHMPIGATVVPLDRPSGPGINVEHLEVNGADKPAATANEVVRSLRKVAYLAGR